MSKLGKLKFDKNTGCYLCTHKLGAASVEVVIDVTQESVEIAELTSAAQGIIDSWPTRHKRLAQAVADELASQGYADSSGDISTKHCIPFYLRICADPDGVISSTVAFNVPSALESEEEYVDVEEEINGEWLNVEICSTE